MSIQAICADGSTVTYTDRRRWLWSLSLFWPTMPVISCWLAISSISSKIQSRHGELTQHEVPAPPYSPTDADKEILNQLLQLELTIRRLYDDAILFDPPGEPIA